MKQQLDLNLTRIQGDGCSPPLANHGCKIDSCDVFFRDLESELIRLISEAEIVVGCVAWLTSEPILKALSQVPHGVGIVVQKEDFLRPDAGRDGGFKGRLRQLYDSLKVPVERDDLEWPCLIERLSTSGPLDAQPIRCVGNHNAEKTPAFPRMHNKFLVFCGMEYVEQEDLSNWMRVVPYAVWTGSFNLTKNASLSLENAVLLKNPAIARAYFQEWGQIMALSEPLDWQQDWIAPEWRLGT